MHAAIHGTSTQLLTPPPHTHTTTHATLPAGRTAGWVTVPSTATIAELKRAIWRKSDYLAWPSMQKLTRLGYEHTEITTMRSPAPHEASTSTGEGELPATLDHHDIVNGAVLHLSFRVSGWRSGRARSRAAGLVGSCLG